MTCYKCGRIISKRATTVFVGGLPCHYNTCPKRKKQKYNLFEEERQRNADRLVTLKLHTRVPSKYRVIDLETGDVWKNVGGKWKVAKDTKFQCVGMHFTRKRTKVSKLPPART